MCVENDDGLCKERILVVDDEQQILKMIKRMLEISGYSVVAKESSLEALDAFTQSPDSFNAVLTDLSMPHMTGDQLSRRIMEIRPDIPIILCTGYSDLLSESHAREIGISQYLTKPCFHKQIVEAVRQALAGRKEAPCAP